MKKAICIILLIALAGIIIYSANQILIIQADYKAEELIHEQLLGYKPPESRAIAAEEKIVNQSVIDLQSKYSDAVGWLNIPNTKIDYPFIQSGDNDYYLGRDINGKRAVCGSIFMDFRCSKSFSSQNTILYGHHMKNGSMFGTIKLFENKEFFKSNIVGTIYLPNDTLTLEIFAYMVVHPGRDTEIFSDTFSEDYFTLIKEKARNYRELNLSTDDRIVTLSTCAYEFENARMILLARIKK